MSPMPEHDPVAYDPEPERNASASTSAPAPEKRQSGRDSLLTLAGAGLAILVVSLFCAALLGLPPFGGMLPASQSPAPASPATTSSPAAVQTAQSTPLALATAAPTVAPTTTSPALLPPTPMATPAARRSWPPAATASRMDLLTPCPDQANCYIYVVRAAGATGPR